MISFIDPSIYKDGVTITVIVYSDDKEKAVKKIKALISGEKILEERESYHEYRAIVEKGNIKIQFRNLPVSAHLKGYRSQYAIIDKCIIAHEMSKELFFNSIRPITLMYPHLLKDDEKGNEIIQFMLF